MLQLRRKGLFEEHSDAGKVLIGWRGVRHGELGNGFEEATHPAGEGLGGIG